jgi:glycosyltransferase involved in cell wall biosynthesis
MSKNDKCISIIGTVGVPACYGGFETLVENLLSYAPEQIRYTVFCSADKYPNKIPFYKNAKLKYVKINANGMSSTLYDIICMCKSLNSDVMLILGVSGCLFLPVLRLLYKGKIITNIDGLEWKREKWNNLARLFLRTSERFAVKYSHTVIGDNKGITDYVSNQYSKNAELIEYGGDQAVPVENSKFYTLYPFSKHRYAVTVCRIEPENNIGQILEAFSAQNAIPLVIIGNWKNSEYGIQLYRTYAMHPFLTMLDPVYEQEHINFIRSHASMYIHGHSAGGTNPSLVEAMNLGLPILAFDCLYNRATTEDCCLFWKDSKDLLCLINAKHDLSRLGNKMKLIAKERYSWKIIAQKYCKIY